MKCWISVCYPLKTHENKHNSNQPRTVWINSSITIAWSLSSCNVCTRHDNLWTWRTLPKPFIVETIQSRIGLSQHWLASSNNYSDCTHKSTCIEFMKFSNSTAPLTWSLSEYPKLEQSKAVRQKIHLSSEFFSDWRCTFSFESDHVHFTSPITPKMQYGERFHVSFDAICRPIARVLCIMNSEEIPEYQCSCSFTHKTSREKCHLIIKWSRGATLDAWTRVNASSSMAAARSGG